MASKFEHCTELGDNLHHHTHTKKKKKVHNHEIT